MLDRDAHVNRCRAKMAAAKTRVYRIIEELLDRVKQYQVHNIDIKNFDTKFLEDMYDVKIEQIFEDGNK